MSTFERFITSAEAFRIFSAVSMLVLLLTPAAPAAAGDGPPAPISTASRLATADASIDDGSLASAWTIGKNSHALQTTLAATSIFLLASRTGDQELLARVSTPSATYYPSWGVKRTHHGSAPLTTLSLSDIQHRCLMRSVDPCVQTAVVTWACNGQKEPLCSRVHVNDSGKIVSVTGDDAPMVCLVQVSPS